MQTMRTLLLSLVTGGLYLLDLSFRWRKPTHRHDLLDLVLVRLTPEQVTRAEAANRARRHITHALICGPFGQMFGTEQQCRKHFDSWNPAREPAVFPTLFRQAVELDDFAIADYSNTDDLVLRLIDAQYHARESYSSTT